MSWLFKIPVYFLLEVLRWRWTKLNEGHESSMDLKEPQRHDDEPISSLADGNHRIFDAWHHGTYIVYTQDSRALSLPSLYKYHPFPKLQFPFPLSSSSLLSFLQVLLLRSSLAFFLLPSPWLQWPCFWVFLGSQSKIENPTAQFFVLAAAFAFYFGWPPYSSSFCSYLLGKLCQNFL